jgi:coenzyme F420 hydrogenase subunit beta
MNGGIGMQAFGQKELLEDVHENDLCVGCGACVGLCPYFKNYRGKTAMIFPCDLEKGRCYAFCPKAEVDLDELYANLHGRPYEGSPLGYYREICAASAGEKMAGGSFQAGGVASALTTFAFEKGLIDSAVLTDREGLVPVPRLITESSEVLECATSKYMAASTLSEVNRGAKEGYKKMAVVCTPCQATALGQMSANPLERSDFDYPVSLVIGLFCTWALDTRKLIAMLRDRIDIGKIKKMDIPPPPAEVFVIEMDEGKVEIPLDEIRPLVPHGCLICPDMTSELADVSVGVLEGEPDWNTLIIRTEKGKKFIEEAIKEGWVVTKEIPQEKLDHLIFAGANKKKRAIDKANGEGLLNTSEKTGRSALRIKKEAIARISSAQE